MLSTSYLSCLPRNIVYPLGQQHKKREVIIAVMIWKSNELRNWYLSLLLRYLVAQAWKFFNRAFQRDFISFYSEVSLWVISAKTNFMEKICDLHWCTNRALYVHFLLSAGNRQLSCPDNIEVFLFWSRKSWSSQSSDKKDFHFHSLL